MSEIMNLFSFSLFPVYGFYYQVLLMYGLSDFDDFTHLLTLRAVTHLQTRKQWHGHKVNTMQWCSIYIIHNPDWSKF